MKYKAIVVDNNSINGFPGSVRVVCKELFGFVAPDNYPSEMEAILDGNLNVSGWIPPLRPYSQDVYLPRVGCGVFIEEIYDGSYIWDGTWEPEFDIASGAKRIKSTPLFATDSDRVISNGNSYIVLNNGEDTEDPFLELGIYANENLSPLTSFIGRLRFQDTLEGSNFTLQLFNKNKEVSTLDIGKQLLFVGNPQNFIYLNKLLLKVVTGKTSIETQDNLAQIKTDKGSLILSESAKLSQDGCSIELKDKVVLKNKLHSLAALVKELFDIFSTFQTVGLPALHNVHPQTALKLENLKAKFEQLLEE